MALTTKDMEFILQIMRDLKCDIAQDNKVMEGRINNRIEEFEEKAHDMVANFRAETRQAIEKFAIKTNITLNKIFSQVGCHNTDLNKLNSSVKEMDKRLTQLESKQIKETQKSEKRKKTTKEFFKYLVDKFTMPVLTTLITTILLTIILFFLNKRLVSKEVEKQNNNNNIIQKQN
jgi:vacuolar-type H+-ATPase subunit I/STV1